MNVLLAAVQLAIILLSATRYCIFETKALNLEGFWLSMLILLQLFKIVSLSVWDVTLNRNRIGYFNYILKSESNGSFHNDGQTLQLRQSEIEKRMKQHAEFRNMYLQGTTVKKPVKAAPPPRKAPKR